MRTFLWIGFVVAAACGGSQSGTSTTPKSDSGGGSEANHPTSQGGLTAEQIESVDAVFRRKAGSLNTCWQDEHVKSGDRKVQGEVTVGLTVQKSGKPSKVKILKSTINNVPIEECVQREVSAWVFPELPSEYPYSRSVHLGAQY